MLNDLNFVYWETFYLFAEFSQEDYHILYNIFYNKFLRKYRFKFKWREKSISMIEAVDFLTDEVIDYLVYDEDEYKFIQLTKLNNLKSDLTEEEYDTLNRNLIKLIICKKHFLNDEELFTVDLNH
jgi:hypothetical protein